VKGSQNLRSHDSYKILKLQSDADSAHPRP